MTIITRSTLAADLDSAMRTGHSFRPGQVVTPKRTFGWHGRFAIAIVRGRSLGNFSGGATPMEWFIWDAETPDAETGLPTSVIQQITVTPSLDDAWRAVEDTAAPDWASPDRDDGPFAHLEEGYCRDSDLD